MFCSVCGRKLKSPLSIEAGCGPVCYQNLYGKALNSRESLRKGVVVNQTEKGCYDIPGQISLEDYLQELDGK